jgi:leader peptidase (prepilin peptidase)/N-methyltransferase
LIEALAAFLFGLLIGSFLNVCIYRMPHDLSVVQPRSFCPKCKATISWFDNVPVLSWLALRGRCRRCGASILWRYPFVEVLTGAFFFYGVYANGPSLAALKFCVFAAVMIALVFTDFEQRILPDEFTLGGILVGIAFALVAPAPPGLISLFLPRGMSDGVRSLIESAFAALFLGGLLWMVGEFYWRIRKREGLGFGDVKMVACIAAFLGLGPALLTVAAGSILGSVTGLLYIWLARKEAASYELPFGSFLGIAALLIAIYNPAWP